MLPRLRAERQLAAIEAASVPHLGKLANRIISRHSAVAAGDDGSGGGSDGISRPSLNQALLASGIPVVMDPGGDGTSRDETKGAP
jgi:hypothetical protein